MDPVTHFQNQTACETAMANTLQIARELAAVLVASAPREILERFSQSLAEGTTDLRIDVRVSGAVAVFLEEAGREPLLLFRAKANARRNDA